MIDQRLKDLQGTSRRDFMRWASLMAACVGLERSRFLNFLSDTAGTAMADTAACASTNRSMHIVDGGGGIANTTLLFTPPKVLTGGANGSHYAIGQGTNAAGYDNPFMNGPDTPWQTGSTWKMSAYVCGANQTHTNTPGSAASLGQNQMLASIAAVQQANPTLLPVLAVGGNLNAVYGTAPGAPAIAAVNNPNQLVGLFNSQASKALLQASANGPLAETYFKAFVGLNAATGRSTTDKAYNTAKTSMNLLAKNLGPQLTPTTTDLAAMGIGNGGPGAVETMGRSMITALKAFSLGLSSSLIVGGFSDDPHGLFAGGNGAASTKAKAYGKMLQGLHDLAKQLPDPSCSAKTLADALIFTAHGDTIKDPFNRNGWPDGTPMGSNVLYVMGGGHTKTGWFGELTDGNTARPFDIATGQLSNAAYGTVRDQLANAAGACAVFAACKGDARRVQDFYNGPAIDGLVNVSVTG